MKLRADLRPPLLDILTAGGFLVAGELELFRHATLENPRWVDVVAMGVLMMSLAWRRRLPILVAVVGCASIAVLASGGDVQTLNFPMVVLFVPPYSVGKYEPRERAWLGLIVCLGAPLAVALFTPQPDGVAFTVGMVAASWAAGRATRANGLRAQALRREAARVVAANDEVQRLALAEERSRIARELQAVVTASVSEMVLTAETAARLLTTEPVEADRMMASVEVTAQQVLADVRRVLDILRDSMRDWADLADDAIDRGNGLLGRVATPVPAPVEAGS
jgi:signal transduction histidine kinase